MNGFQTAAVAYGATIALGTVAWARIARNLRRPSEAERVAAADMRVGFLVWDFTTEQWMRLTPGTQPGPGQMTARQIEEADPLELLYLARAYDPYPDTGEARLQAAIDNDQTDQGDQ